MASNDMRRLALRLLLLAPLGVLVIGTNYVVDPGNLFVEGEPEAEIAARLAAGREMELPYLLDL